MEAAVAGYAEGVLKSSVGKLGSFLLNEAWLIANVREDIISIRDELQSMDAVLRDLICARQLNQQNKVWMFHVLQVACDAELCIDEFTEILGGRCGHGFAGAARRAARFTSTVVPRRRISKMIQELKVRAKELSERRARYSTTIQTNMPDTSEFTRRARAASRHLMQNWHLIAEDKLVGFDSETQSRVKQLARKSGVTTVIVGPAGSGKTALAKMAYRRRKDPINGIQASAWVTLSENPNKKWVFQDILRQLNGFHEVKDTDNEEELANKLQKHLDQKRFLLVFDSLRILEDWEKMKEAFPQRSKGTIVATTQDMDVARALVNKEEKNIIEIGLGEKQFFGQHRKDLCAKLLFNLTSATQSRYHRVMQIIVWFAPLVFYCRLVVHALSKALNAFFKALGGWLSGVSNWFSVQIWLHLGLMMVVLKLISYQVVCMLFGVVWTCFHGQHWDLIILVLITFQDFRKWLRRFIGNHRTFTMVILVSISSQVFWHLFQGQVWLALSKVTLIVVLLLFKVIRIQLNEILHNLKGKDRFLAAWFIMIFFICIIMTPFVFLYFIIFRVVSLLNNYIVLQVQRIVYEHLTGVKGVSLNMVHHYLRLSGSRILGAHSLLPLEVKFICGALTYQRMDSNTVDKFFKKLDQLANNTNNKERLEEVTMTCYHLMSQSLKQCAQDLHKVLSECHAVKRKRITRRWIATNLAISNRGKSSEEVAECYFEELHVRGFIEPESVHPTGKTKTCRINSVFKSIDPIKLNSTGEINPTQLNFTECSGENQQTSSPNDVAVQLFDNIPDPMQLHGTKSLLDDLKTDDVSVELNFIKNSGHDLQRDRDPFELFNLIFNPTKNSRHNMQIDVDWYQISKFLLNSTKNSRDNVQTNDVPVQLSGNLQSENSWDNQQEDDIPALLSDTSSSPTEFISDENSQDNQQGDDILALLSDTSPSPTELISDENSQDNQQGDDIPALLSDISSSPTDFFSDENSKDNFQGDDGSDQLSDIQPNPSELISDENSQDNFQGDDASAELSNIQPNPTQLISNENSQDNLQRDDVSIQSCHVPPEPTQLNLDENSQNNLDVLFQLLFFDIHPDPTQVNSTENKQRLLCQLFHVPPSTVFELFRKYLGIKYSFFRKGVKHSESLIVLDLEGCKNLDKTDLSSLCRFVRLRFLSVRNTDVTEVPPKIGKLKQLETLDVRETKIKKVPKDILHLKHLKHLLAGYFYKPESTTGDSHKEIARSIEMPVGMDEMSNLETLAYVSATRTSNLLISVRELTQLRKLGLVIREDNLNSRPLCISLMMLSDSLHSLLICDERERDSLEFLEYLCFPPHNLNSLTLSGYLGRLPQWVGDHKLLSKLTLASTQLRSNAIRLIGRIPTLLCLKLYRDSYDEYSLNLTMNEFAVLKVLIIHCDAIQMISFEKGSAAKLEVFRWVFSKAQRGEVWGTEHLPMLKEVSLIGDINVVLEDNIKGAVIKHSNRESTLMFEKIEKKILDSNDSNA